MRNYLFLTGLAAVALTTSCSEDFDLLGNKHEVTLSASVTAEGTRAAFKLEGNTAKFYWNTDDKIGVTSTGNTTSFSSFTLQGVGGSATANFSGTVSGEVTNASYAVYPYNAGHSMSESTLSYVFPSEYTYTSVSSEFFPGTADCNSFNPAMWAKVGSDKSISFKHLGGIFVIKFGSMPLTEGKLVLSADQQMAGTFTANLSDNETPTCTNTQEDVTNSSTKVTIEFSGATKDADGVFYVPVPVGTYKNVFVELYAKGAEKASQTVAAGSFTVTRKLLQPLKLNSETVSGGEATTAETAADATKELESSDNVSITNLVSDGTTAEGESGTVSATITIPAVTASSSEDTGTGSTTSTVAENTQKTVAVEKIPEKAVITLADAKTTTSESDEKKASVESVVLSIPHMAASTDDDKAKLPTVNVTMPNTTVTLAGNAGTANFGTVTAETAEKTLVVSSGVTIQKLVVKKGNVRIESGATVVAIVKDDSYSGTTPIIYYEEGASFPESLTGFDVKKLSFIDTESDFATAINSGGDCMLTKNLTLTKAYTASKTVSIDLNGKTLTANENLCMKDGNLTFTNGNITQNGKSMNVDSNGALTLDNVKYTGTGWSCLFIAAHAKNASITVKNSNIAGGYYAVTSNASENEVASDCKYDLENSTFTAEETGVLINIPATVTMKNCTFSGNHQGGLLRGGTYTISGCTFTLNATLDASHYENNWMKTWADGNRCAFAALTIGNYLNGAYKYATNVTFPDTNKAEVSGTNASSFPAIHVCANNYTVTITGMSSITKTGGKTEVEYGTTNITVDSKDPVSYISNESDFTTAFSNGGIYVLKNDVTLSSNCTTGKTVAIDLNGKTLTTAKVFGTQEGGALIMRNGNLVQDSQTTTIGSPLAIGAYTYIIGGHGFVDLGLTSGLLWATCNVGATSAADYGNYYTWDEASSALSGWGSCSVPTNAQLEELESGCTWTWTTQTNSSNASIKGYKVTSKTKGNSIFLPAAGYKDGGSVKSKGSYGFYRSSTSSQVSGTAYGLTFNSSVHVVYGSQEMADGCSIRPVLADKPQ